MQLLDRQAALRLLALGVGAVPRPAASDADLSSVVRRAVVRGAQIADQADSVWQQVAGEVVPAWQRPRALPQATVPPPLIDRDFARVMLDLPLEVAARCGGSTSAALQAQVPNARQDAVLLYKDGAAPTPLQNEPFYGALSRAGEPPPGTAVRGFAPSLIAAASAGDFSNSTLFGFEAYARWRVLTAALSDEREPEERRRLQVCFYQAMGDAMLDGPLRDVPLPESPRPGVPRSGQSLQSAVDGCGRLLDALRAKGLFSRYSLQTTLGSGSDLFDEGDWQDGGSTGWQYVVSGSALVGGSQLAQDRTAATGRGAGLYPGQLLTAPLSAFLRRRGVAARLEEYFLDNRVGRPDPRTFSDPRYYSDVLLEVVALEEPNVGSRSEGGNW